jgi:lysophospholipase L1-like esterase
MKTWMIGLAAAAALGSTASAQAPSGPAAPPTGIVADPCVGRIGDRPDDQRDWPNLCRYAAQNAALPPPAKGEPPRVVFLGDSITLIWKDRDPPFFAAETGRIDRGISGQTTPQMLVRFMADVVALHPRVVHIMAATNDIAGNTGPETLQGVKNNLMAMATLARANGIKVILASTPPADDFPWRKGMNPAPKIAELNAWIRSYAAKEGFVYADYTAVLDDGHGAMKQGLATDGVHPVTAGYKVMEPVTLKAIDQALGKAKTRRR